MNSVILIGRTTKEPEIRYSQGNKPMAIARFSMAVDRPVKNGEEKKADFPSVICFGKTAEFIEKYIGKGQKIAVQGRLQTGSYKNKDGVTVYTTDVIADKIEPCEWKNEKSKGDNSYSGFTEADENDDDLPF